MKKLLMFLCAVTLVFGMMGSASAFIIFEDDFTCASYPQNTVGNGWIEVDNGIADVQIRSQGGIKPLEGELFLRDKPASVTHKDSTVGLTNIELTFDWRGKPSNESTDRLFLSWFNGSMNFDKVLSLDIDTQQSFTSASFLFPVLASSNQSGFGFTLFTEVANDDGIARIRNVKLTGDPVPEPTTIALLVIGLAGLAGAEARRRKKKKAVDKS